MKYKLTTNTKRWAGVTLYQIEYLKPFMGITKGDLGGWIENESNLSQEGNAYVSGNARVYGNACVFGDAYVSGSACVFGDSRVYGNARVSAKANFTKGRFIGGDDSGKITNITNKTGTTYWRNQYVLGEYEITPIEEPTITLTREQIITECGEAVQRVLNELTNK